MSTTIVRMKVAMSELISSTPTLAKIAVSAANTAESTAQNCQDDRVSGFMELSSSRASLRGAKRRSNPAAIGVALAAWIASIPVVRQHRQRRDFDAFVDQAAGLLRRGLTVDRTMFDVAIMHLAGFAGKALADIVGVLDDMIAQLLELGAQLALLRHHQLRGWRGIRSRCRRYGRRGFATLPAYDLRGHDGTFHFRGAANRTVDQLAFFLVFIGGRA